MEKMLKALFDYQHFEKNKHLEKLISEAEQRFECELSDEELAAVTAGAKGGRPEGDNADPENQIGARIVGVAQQFIFFGEKADSVGVESVKLGE